MSTRIAACARVLARSAAAVLAVSALAGCSANDATEHVAVTTTKLGGTLGYSSPVINVFRHQKVVIDLTNNTDDMRAFAIDEYGIAKTVDPGQHVVVRFKADKPGIFRIHDQVAPSAQDARLVVAEA